MANSATGRQVESGRLERMLGTPADKWRRAWTGGLFTRSTAFATLSAYSSCPSLVTPTAASGITWVDPCSLNAVIVQPYGTGADNSDFGLRVYGASEVDQDAPQWVPTLWAHVQCRLGTATATIGGTSCRLAEFLTTVLALAKAPGLGVQLLQPTTGDNTPAQLVFDFAGSCILGFEFTLDGASSAATGMGALWRAY